MPYYFELPDIRQLTIAQQAVLNDPGSVSVYGGPGTGKSITSLWRHIRNYDTGAKESLLLTYTMPLVAYLAGAARTINDDAADNIAKTQYWLQHEAKRYEEIIIDEAQDLSEDVYLQVKRYAKAISYGADDQQSIYPGQATTQEDLKTLFPGTKSYPLDENFRNSYEILRFVLAALPNKIIPLNTMNTARTKRTTNIKPRILVTGWSSRKQSDAIIDLIGRFHSENHNIGVLVPFPNDVEATYELISPHFECTKYHHLIHVLPLIENVHVTTYASAKGVEFDTVIMPQFEHMRDYIKTKYAATESHYYVALTRARTNLFLIAAKKPSDISSTTYELDIL
ncbi:AAA family ATPase [Mucilaginibacter sp. 21P]|uniref:DNA/RNA helicase domain-containing protein n=1 Tax=Mucilaginibacter sp. 21P TaxID=2778902 RepID=UPI001C585AB3|nr:DNA/RNA helicase domain-containing protein [Mucilaginibacter sp. 21P]QXV63993.1 AAA family ATPase [Mucilaginibacter sp. 21P]